MLHVFPWSVGAMVTPPSSIYLFFYSLRWWIERCSSGEWTVVLFERVTRICGIPIWLFFFFWFWEKVQQGKKTHKKNRLESEQFYLRKESNTDHIWLFCPDFLHGVIRMTNWMAMCGSFVFPEGSKTHKKKGKKTANWLNIHSWPKVGTDSVFEGYNSAHLSRTSAPMPCRAPCYRDDRGLRLQINK